MRKKYIQTFSSGESIISHFCGAALKNFSIEAFRKFSLSFITDRLDKKMYLHCRYVLESIVLSI